MEKRYPRENRPTLRLGVYPCLFGRSRRFAVQLFGAAEPLGDSGRTSAEAVRSVGPIAAVSCDISKRISTAGGRVLEAANRAAARCCIRAFRGAMTAALSSDGRWVAFNALPRWSDGYEVLRRAGRGIAEA